MLLWDKDFARAGRACKLTRILKTILKIFHAKKGRFAWSVHNRYWYINVSVYIKVLMYRNFFRKFKSLSPISRVTKRTLRIIAHFDKCTTLLYGWCWSVLELSESFLTRARESVTMKHQTGPRAATLRKLIDGSAWNQARPHRTTIIVMPELLDKAALYNLFAPKGKNGLRSIRVYLEDCILRDIKEIDQRKKELRDRSNTD